MEIINDLEAEVTINTKTGDYLTLVDQHGFSLYFLYELHIKNVVYKIHTNRAEEQGDALTEIHKVGLVELKRPSDLEFHELSNIADVYEIIEAFLLVFKRGYGGPENVNFRVDFDAYDKNYDRL